MNPTMPPFVVRYRIDREELVAIRQEAMADRGCCAMRADIRQDTPALGIAASGTLLCELELHHDGAHLDGGVAWLYLDDDVC